MRDRALLAVLWRTGLSIREVLALTGEQVRLEEEVPVQLLLSSDAGANAGPRELDLDSTAREELGRWLDVRRQVLRVRRVNLTTSRLFCTINADQAGLPLAISWVRLTISRLGKRASLQRGVRSAVSRSTQAVAQRAAVRSLRSDLTPHGTVLHEIVDRAVHDALGIYQPSEGLDGLLDLGVVLDVLEARLIEELQADEVQVVETSATPDVWRRVSAR